MIRSNILLLLLTLSAAPLLAQPEETIFGTRGWGLSGFWFGYTHQYTEFGGGNSGVSNGAGFVAWEFGRCLLVGFAHYDLQDEFNWNATENRRFDARWNVLKLGYTFLPHKAIHPMLNLDFGGGRADLQDVGRDRFFIAQPSGGIELNLFHGVRLGLEGGYRFVGGVTLDPLTNAGLSGLFGQATLKLGASWGHKHHP